MSDSHPRHDAAAREPGLSAPILPGKGASDYERYLRTDALLALQKRPEEMTHRDELLFQIVHQVSELWLKLAAGELEEATALLEADDLAPAARLLRRAVDCIGHLTQALRMFEHLAPRDYAELRRALGHASGFDSPGFTAVRDVTRRLGTAFDQLLERRGLSVVDVYVRDRELDDLYRCAELMLRWDEELMLWRAHHVKVAERAIGIAGVGTQGTPVEALTRLTGQRSFPELWGARDELSRRAGP